jgi:hypothetical protein
LRAAVGVVDQRRDVVSLGLAGPQPHVERFEGEVGAQRGRQLPAHDPTAEHVDHERPVDPAGEGPAVGVGVGPERPAVSRSVGFSGPPSEPDVRLPPHPALHMVRPLVRVILLSTMVWGSLRPGSGSARC